MFRFSATALFLRLLYGVLLLQISTFSTTPVSGSVDNTSDMGLFGGSSSTTDTATTGRGHVPLDVDGYPVAPPELELEQVHIYVRHGTPLRPALPSLPR